MEVTTKALRAQMRAVLACVDRGESVTITYRGKPRASIVPLAADGARRGAELPAYGMWKDRDDLEDVQAYVRNLRKPRHVG